MIEDIELRVGLREPKKEMEMFVETSVHRTNFYSTYAPDMIEEAIVDYLNSQGVSIQTHKSKYKLAFTLDTVDQGG